MTLVESLKELVAEERKLDAEIKDLEGRRKAMKQLILDELTAAKVEKTDVDGYSVSIVTPKERESFNRAGLVKAGVTPDLIDKAATKTVPTPYLSIRKAGEAE